MKKRYTSSVVILAIFCHCLVAKAYEVSSFTLMNTQTATEVKIFANYDTIQLSNLPRTQVCLWPNTADNIGDILFKFDAEIVPNQSNAPYAFLRDSGYNYNSLLYSFRGKDSYTFF